MYSTWVLSTQAQKFVIFKKISLGVSIIRFLDDNGGTYGGMQFRYLFTSKKRVFNMGVIYPSPKVGVSITIIRFLGILSIHIKKPILQQIPANQFGCYIFLMVKTYCKKNSWEGKKDYQISLGFSSQIFTRSLQIV